MAEHRRQLSVIGLVHLHIIFLVSIIFLIILIAGYIFCYDIFYLEDHCQKVAEQELGGQKGWINKQVDSPYWGGQKIFIGFEKQLECEHNAKPFFFF